MSGVAGRTIGRVLWLVAGVAAASGTCERFAAADDAGAEHWAYRPIRRPQVPSPRQIAWPRAPLDAFLLERLEAAGGRPADETSRERLARRLSLTLVGLPPSLERLDDFAADDGPDAVERLVDRLLASPAYGERMASPWLDLARYADTHGYHADTHREMWRWRDWVIDALNQGRPFDEFSIEQLAGDLLPAATLDQRIATGFQRNHMIIFENGVIAEEYRQEYVADRTNTFATVWLAQTFQCARCHDHKHDPFTQRDYYRLAAFFNNVPESGVDGQAGNAAPFLAAPTRLQRESAARLERELANLDDRIARRLAETDEGQRRWEESIRRRLPELVRPPADVTLRLKLDEMDGKTARNSAPTSTDGGSKPAVELEIHGEPNWLETKEGRALLLDGSTWIDAAALGPADREAPWSAALLVFPTSTGTLPLVARTNDDADRRGWELALVDGRVQLRMTSRKEEDELLVRTEGTLANRRWQRVLVTYDGSSRAAGVAIHVDGRRLETRAVRDSLAGSIRTPGSTRIGRNAAGDGFRGMLRDVRLWARALAAPEVAVLAGRDPVAEILAIPGESRAVEQRRQLRRWYLEAEDAEFRGVVARRDDAERRLSALRSSFPTTMVMAELPTPRVTHVLERGDYRNPREAVEPGVPARLAASLDADAPNLRPGRLELARWLFAPDNSLVARVAANRAWQVVFGAGLARTSDDFGTHGESPSHPELLDWLADRLRRDAGWDLKRLHRDLVTSAAFRQGAKTTTAWRERDPENRLWGRGPRSRLPAEMVRDSALAAAGLLDRRVGGPSVAPPQPPGLWEELAYDSLSFTAQKYQPSTGGDVYRRSVYVVWKRAAPHPALATFDQPDRETCVATRSTSSTPLQALVLMNEPTLVAAAVELARDATRRETELDARLVAMFRAVLARRPTSDELRLLGERFAAERGEFAARPAEARRLLAAGVVPSPTAADEAAELAALTLVAGVLLQTDEALAP